MVSGWPYRFLRRVACSIAADTLAASDRTGVAATGEATGATVGVESGMTGAGGPLSPPPKRSPIKDIKQLPFVWIELFGADQIRDGPWPLEGRDNIATHHRVRSRSFGAIGFKRCNGPPITEVRFVKFYFHLWRRCFFQQR